MKIHVKEQASSIRTATGIRLQGRLAARAIRSDIRKELGENAYQAKNDARKAAKAAKQAEKAAVEAAKRAAAWALLDNDRKVAIVSGLINTGFAPQAPVYPTNPFMEQAKAQAKTAQAKAQAATQAVITHVERNGNVRDQAIAMLAAMGFTPGEEFNLLNLDNTETSK